MPKNDKNGSDPLVPVLTPSLSVITDLHNDLQHPAFNVTARNNEYILVELDKQGNEIIGTDFTVQETNFRNSYANNPSFKVKKNPK